MSVTAEGGLAWHTPVTDPHPEISAPHISSVYGDTSTVDVSVDNRV
jgi:hypothetical protein